MTKVCFISSRTGWIKSDTEVSMDMSNGLLVRELAAHYGNNFSLAIISADQATVFDTPISARKVYAMPAPFSYKGGAINTFRFYSILKKIAAENDVLIIQLPFIGFLALPWLHKPAVYHICANVLTAATNPVKYRGVHRVIAESFARLIHRVYKIVFNRKQVGVIANGAELAALYNKFNTKKVISSSLKAEDVIQESDVTGTINNPLQLLFVGRPSLEKGFDTLIDALQDFPVDFKLSIVGFTVEEFRQLLPDVFESSKSFHSKLDFKGYVSWNTGLKDIIRQHHIALVPSRSEGTPRVILENMSQGVAVIASRTGGIPTVIEDNVNGLLIEPGSVQDLREKIMFLQGDQECRKRLISCGLKTASANTIAHFAGHFIDAVEQLSNE